MAENPNDLSSQVVNSPQPAAHRTAVGTGVRYRTPDCAQAFVVSPDLSTQVVNIHHLKVRNPNDSPISGGKYLPPARIQTDHSGYEYS
jgi:hypothetical protein